MMLVPVPVPVPVPLEATVCKKPRSISEPSPRMTPWRVALVVLFPKASFRVTEMVQPEFSVYVPTTIDEVSANCGVELARMLPEPSK